MTDTNRLAGDSSLAIDRSIERLRNLHDYAGRPAWDAVVREELGLHIEALRERAEAAEADREALIEARDMLGRKWMRAKAALTQSRVDGWKAGIEAAAKKLESGLHDPMMAEDIRALALPTPTANGEAS